MNEHTPVNVDILLDRLVDGELSKDEKRRLLVSFDERPENWRRCAMAFLEAQAWREEMKQVARGLAVETVTNTSSAVPSKLAERSRWSSPAIWLAMAASLLMAFGLGWLQRESGTPVAIGPGGTNGPVTSALPPSQAPSSKGTKVNDALTLFVKDDNGRMQPVRVPLVDASTLDKELGVRFQTGVPDDFRDQLKNNGYAVQSKRQYAPLWLENGRPMILPVEDTNITPVSNNIVY